MSERSMSRLVMDAIHFLDPVRVENPAHPGTPDINYCGYMRLESFTSMQLDQPPTKINFNQLFEGWIELKELDKWPARASTIVRVEHFTPQQRIWLDRRWRSGGAAWVLLKVEQDWLLLTGEAAARVLGKVTKGELISAATRHWHGSAYKKELATCLSRRAI